jgi:hypothetical protein
MTQPRDVLTLAAQYRAALSKQDAAALARLVNAYGAMARRMQGSMDALGLELAEAGTLTRGQVARLTRYRDLLEQVADELARYTAFAGVEMDAAARAAIGLAQTHARGLAQSAAGVSLNWNRLPTDAIESLLGFLDPRGPLYARLGGLGPFVADKVSAKILESVALGLNPRQWAGLLRDSLGIGLTDSLRMARTVQLYSYREATRVNYAANSDVVNGWIWFAELDADVCLSCVAQHGTVHGNDEALNDHHNGRCAMLPNIAGEPNPVTQDGQQWFDGLDPSQQRSMMGAGRYEAYTAGKFDFAAQSTTRNDDVYGDMRVEATLKELIGE